MNLTLDTKNLTHSITRALGVSILSGEYRPAGDFPTEAELCQSFDVSRSAMREAVKMLSAKGLLTSRPRRGTSVLPEYEWNLLDPDVLQWMQESKPSLAVLKEFNEMRMAIEPQAAAYMASRASVENMVQLENALERMRKATIGEDDPLDSDIAFHVALLEGSGNRFFRQLTMLTRTALKFSIRLTNQQKGVDTADFKAHKAVYDGIKAGHSEKVRQLVQTMLVEVDLLIVKAMNEKESRAG